MRKHLLRSLFTKLGRHAGSGRSKRRTRHKVAVTELLEPRTLLSAAVADGGFENPVQPENTFEQASGTGSGTLVGSEWTITSGATTSTC